MSTRVFEVDADWFGQVKRFVCVHFARRPSEAVYQMLYESVFMHAFLKPVEGQGMACWHAVADDETRALAQEFVDEYFAEMGDGMEWMR